MTAIVVAIASSTVFIDGQRVHIRQGSAWAADSVVVQLHPSSFSDDPTKALGLDIVPPAAEPEPTPEPEPAPVEQKTAAPGEKANVMRRNA